MGKESWLTENRNGDGRGGPLVSEGGWGEHIYIGKKREKFG